MASNETFSSWPVSALVAGVKMGSIALAFDQAGRQRDAADRSRSRGIPSSRCRRDSREPRTRTERRGPCVTTIERPRERLALAAARDRKPASSMSVEIRWLGTFRRSNQKMREAGQDAPLVGDAVGQDPVERADAIGRDQEEPIAQVVDVADLAAAAWGSFRSRDWFRAESCRAGSTAHLACPRSRGRCCLRNSQLDGAAEIGPLIAKTAIW